MAQLDQLGAAKTVAQYASVIGPEFQVDLLAHILEQAPKTVASQLRGLERSRILTPVSGTSDGYRFKHTLIHEIAYRSLLRKTRRQLRLAVARELSTSPSNTVSPTFRVLGL
jgi:predicted ATPase